MENNREGRKNTLKIAGAFVIWVIGSGFATGQEILQFYTSFGYWSYGIIAVELFGFIFLGQALLKAGFRHKTDRDFNPFKFFCGEKLGAFYSFLIPVIIFFLIPVLLSGAGATLEEHYHLNHYLGAAGMAFFVLISYLIGFEKFVKVVSKIGPVIIFFSLLVGLLTIVQDYSNFFSLTQYEALLAPKQTTVHWLLSAFLYLSLNLFPGSLYYTELGTIAKHPQEIKKGVWLGASALVLAIFIMNTAIFLNSAVTAKSAIPMLYLAGKVFTGLGNLFSIILILGIFSSCSAMMWSLCSRFDFLSPRYNKILAVGIITVTYFLSLFPFGELVAFFYPLIGYIGLVFLGCLFYKMIKKEL